MNLKVTVNGIAYQVEVEVDDTPAGLPPLQIGSGPAAPLAPSASSAAPVADAGHTVTAPLAGSVRKILVDVGQSVAVGDVVAVLEAMKMETEISTAVAGKVGKVMAEVGQAVQGGDPLMRIEPAR